MKTQRYSCVTIPCMKTNRKVPQKQHSNAYQHYTCKKSVRNESASPLCLAPAHSAGLPVKNSRTPGALIGVPTLRSPPPPTGVPALRGTSGASGAISGSGGGVFDGTAVYPLGSVKMLPEDPLPLPLPLPLSECPSPRFELDILAPLISTLTPDADGSREPVPKGLCSEKLATLSPPG